MKFFNFKSNQPWTPALVMKSIFGTLLALIVILAVSGFAMEVVDGVYGGVRYAFTGEFKTLTGANYSKGGSDQNVPPPGF